MRTTGLLEIHGAVFLFGFAGLFGKLLAVTPIAIVFGRTLFAWIALLVLLIILRETLRVKSKRDWGGFLLLGVILGIHWVAFFHSIQISTVAVGLLTFSTFPIFVTFLEPAMSGQRVTRLDICLALVVFAGLALIIPRYDLSDNLTLGAIWGTVSGFTFALLTVLNRKYVARYPALAVAFYQDLSACLLLFPFFLLSPTEPGRRDVLLLIVLGVACTAIAHTLFIQGMLAIKARTASIIACLEPVYGIVLAIALLREIPTARIVAGGVIIVGTTLVATIQSGRRASGGKPREGDPRGDRRTLAD